MLVGLVAHKSSIAQRNLRYDSIAEYGTAYWLFSVMLMIFSMTLIFIGLIAPCTIQKFTIRFIKYTTNQPTRHLGAVFAFHPLEGVVEAGIISPIIPNYFWTVFAFLIFMTVYNVYGHLGHEIFPKGFNKNRIGKWLYTSVSHNAHNTQFKGNYGLYFLFCHLCGWES